MGGPLSKVDALFAGEPSRRPNTTALVQRVMLLLMVGAGLTATGSLLWTGVPGALILLVAWLQIDSQSVALDAGELPEAESRRLRQVRAVASVALGVSALSLLFQIWLLAAGQRPLWWGLLTGG